MEELFQLVDPDGQNVMLFTGGTNINPRTIKEEILKVYEERKDEDLSELIEERTGLVRMFITEINVPY